MESDSTRNETRSNKENSNRQREDGRASRSGNTMDGLEESPHRGPEIRNDGCRGLDSRIGSRHSGHELHGWQTAKCLLDVQQSMQNNTVLQMLSLRARHVPMHRRGEVRPLRRPSLHKSEACLEGYKRKCCLCGGNHRPWQKSCPEKQKEIQGILYQRSITPIQVSRERDDH